MVSDPFGLAAVHIVYIDTWFRWEPVPSRWNNMDISALLSLPQYDCTGGSWIVHSSDGELLVDIGRGWTIWSLPISNLKESSSPFKCTSGHQNQSFDIALQELITKAANINKRIQKCKFRREIAMDVSSNSFFQESKSLPWSWQYNVRQVFFFRWKFWF